MLMSDKIDFGKVRNYDRDILNAGKSQENELMER